MSGTPSKEYIYLGAGGRLIATEEPAGSAPPPVPTGVIAKPNGSATTIQVSWSASSGAVSYTVQRRLTPNDSSPVTLSASSTSLIDTVPFGSTYLYYVSANGSGGSSSAYSTLTSTSFATAISFFFSAPTPPLMGGQVVSAAHINTIRTGIDAVRHAAQLPSFSYSYSISAGSTIKASDFIDIGFNQSMRTALTQAYTNLGLSTPSFTNSISAGARVNFADYSDFSGYTTKDGLIRGFHP